MSAGTVNARNQTGTAKITATTDNGYSASCVVTVSEDTMGLIQTGTVAAGTAMNLANTSASTVFDVNNPDQPQFSGSIVSILNSLVRYKHNSSLSYVSNLSVSTAQGVLYYSYVSEADPGAGVGSTESYYVSGAQGLLALNQVSFVPRAGFTGSADISYIAWTVDNKSVTGTIRVPVSGSGGSASGGISYTAKAGEPARFNSSDFDAVCRARTGRSLSYVTFYLPSESYGTLYYNYTGGYGERQVEGEVHHPVPPQRQREAGQRELCPGGGLFRPGGGELPGGEHRRHGVQRPSHHRRYPPGGVRLGELYGHEENPGVFPGQRL